MPNEYKNRHNRLGQYLHWKICKHFSIGTQGNWYEHHPEPVTEGKDTVVLWDFPIHTDRTIQANRPDIVIKDKTNNTCLFIDMSIPSDRNVSAKVFEKLSKYKVLEIEVESKEENLFACLFTFLRVCLHFSGANHKALILHVTLWCIFS